ncbi:uncharacterized protein LOC121879886 [Homarus americanus]|nr:uncharacterized protein LOC121879886 [Homarus americanus]
MTRQVEQEANLSEKQYPSLTTTTTSSSSGRKTEKTRKLSSPCGVTSGKTVGGGGEVERGEEGVDALTTLLYNRRLRKTQSDLSDVMYPRLDLLNLDTSPTSAVTTPTSAVTTPTLSSVLRGASDTTSWTSPTATSRQYSSFNSSYDQLSCEDQESKINLLRHCLSSLDTIESTILKDTIERIPKKMSSDDLDKEELLAMFKRAVDTLQKC